MNYKFLFFDADDTLLDFKAGERLALEETFRTHNISPIEELCQKFSQTNKWLWECYERKEIEKGDIIKRRFPETFRFFNIPYSSQTGLEEYYQKALSNQHSLTPHALNVCKKLSQTHKMYIITNGLWATQKKRLKECGIMPYFKDVFVSERVGYQKPSKNFFDYAFKNIGNPPKEDVLIIGDSCSSDINGGIAYNVDTCLYNPTGAAITSILPPTYTIRDLYELYEIV